MCLRFACRKESGTRFVPIRACRASAGGRFPIMSGARSLMVGVATVLTGLGVCAIAASVMAVPGLLNADPWLVAGAGAVALLAGLAFLSVSFARRDRSIRYASDRPR